MPGKPTDFVLRVDGLNLPDAARERIAGALQAALMSELGRLDLGGARTETVAYIPHKEWLGLWLRSLANLRDLKGQDFERPLEISERTR
jgi:hypothetical protein